MEEHGEEYKSIRQQAIEQFREKKMKAKEIYKKLKEESKDKTVLNDKDLKLLAFN